MNAIRRNRKAYSGQYIRGILGSLLLLLQISNTARGQFYADTLPANKNVVVEEFTAVHCFFCPAGHALLDSLISENPGRVFGVAMHPSNTSYTAPYAGSPDFRRSYPDAFFSVPFATDSLRFFPGAFVNRREWEPGRRERHPEDWRAETDTVLAESSPLNVGLHVIYDPGTLTFTVVTEVYYTDTVTFPHTLYVYLTEDSLIAEQNNGGVSYVHNHIFRESLTAQWGDSIGGFTLPGSLFTDTLYFSDLSSAYVWPQCHFTAMVRNASDEEIVNAMQAPVQEVLITGVPGTVENNRILFFPNKCTDHFFITSSD